MAAAITGELFWMCLLKDGGGNWEWEWEWEWEWGFGWG